MDKTANKETAEFVYTDEELRLELVDLKNIRDESIEKEQEHKSNVDLTNGVVLGLLFGIVGNFAVIHWYGIFEGLVNEIYNKMFWENLAVFIIAVIAIVSLTIYYRKKVTLHKEKAKEQKAHTETLRKAIRRIEISLEKKNSTQ